MEIHKCHFVKASNFFDGFSDEFRGAVEEGYENHVTWGDADKTLIGIETFREAVEALEGMSVHDHDRFAMLARISIAVGNYFDSEGQDTEGLYVDLEN